MTPQTSPRLHARGMRSAADLSATRPHGDRLRYIAGCRCDDCRQANTEYERDRYQARLAGDWNGIVKADAARKHLFKLSKAGVGRRAVHAATDIAETVLYDIRRGTKTNIRARTERLILAVTEAAISDKSLVDAGPTWKLLDQLLAAGFTKTRLAHELGRQTHYLQLNKIKVTARNAYAVERMHVRLMGTDDTPVDATTARSLIRQLRHELISASRLAREWGLEHCVTGNDLKIPPVIPRSLNKQIEATFRRLMA